MIKDKENCTLTVKVSRVHLSSVAREEITARAYLWGTDVYTDDSDVVAACIHGGWIKGEWTDDVDTAMLDLGNGSDGKRKTKSHATEYPGGESEDAITAPPPSGPMGIPAHRDLHVKILILPRLTKYTSCTRYGITSREFGGQFGSRHSVHDGISYMVKCIRWVENGAEPQARLRGKARRERMRKAMKEVSASFGNINGSEMEQEKEHQPVSPPGEEDERHGPERANSEGDKENRAEATRDAAQPAEETNKSAMDKDVEMADATDDSRAALDVQADGK